MGVVKERVCLHGELDERKKISYEMSVSFRTDEIASALPGAASLVNWLGQGQT